MQKPKFLIWYLLLYAVAQANVQLAMSDAMNIAAQEIAIMLKTRGSNNWASSATVTTAFPLYMDGISGISYYDCKVTANGADAGYVIVNANQTDQIIPECGTSGKTISEKFRALLPGKNVNIFRYGASKYLVVDVSTNNVVAVEGFEVSDQQGSGMFKLNATHMMSDFPDAVIFKNSAAAAGCFPSYTMGQISQMYADQSLHKTAITPGQSIFLQHSIIDTRHGSDTNCTPRWYQVNIDSKHVVGCANTAWAIVYGYWSRFKGKTQLFDGISLLDSNWYVPNRGSTITQVASCMTRCFRYTNSLGLPTGESMTWPSDVPGGIEYAITQGYAANPTCTHRDDDLNTNFTAICNELTNDRPVILYIATSSFYAATIADHYVVVEGARITGGGSYLVYEGGLISVPIQQYCVNYGGSDVNQWISNCVGWCRDYYAIDIDAISSLSFYSDVIQGKPPLTVKFTSVDKTGYGPLLYHWNFGDGSALSTDQNPTHVFQKPGVYTVQVSGRANSTGSNNPSWSATNQIKVYTDLTGTNMLLND